MAEYLDKGGLEHYHSLIKTILDTKASTTALANKADKTELSHYLDLNKTTTQTMKGALYIGSPTINVGNAYTHQRKVTGSITGKNVNGVAFAVAQTGEASFQHKVYNDDGSSAKNDAVMRFWKGHLQIAFNTGSGNVPTEDMYKEIATQEYADGLIKKMPAPSGSVLQDFGIISENKSISITKSGFLIGKAVTFASGKHALLSATESDSGVYLAGIVYTEVNTNNQIAFCIPVVAGQTIYARCSGNTTGRLEQVRLVSPTWEQ